MSNARRYRYALLLLWAVMVLVTNPVWHTVSHLIVDHPWETTEDASGVTWSQDDHCLLCCAVAPLVDAPVSTSAPSPDYQFVEVHSYDETPTYRAPNRLARLRAPPVVA